MTETDGTLELLLENGTKFSTANYNRNSEFGIPVTGNSGQKQTAPEFVFRRNLSEFRKPESENGNYCLWDR